MDKIVIETEKKDLSVQVKSFDLVAVNESVTACDMAHLPVEGT